MNKQASPKSTGEGRKLRRARNVVKRWLKWQCEQDAAWLVGGDKNRVNLEICEEIDQKRYERACALILADKLRNS